MNKEKILKLIDQRIEATIEKLKQEMKTTGGKRKVKIDKKTTKKKKIKNLHAELIDKIKNIIIYIQKYPLVKNNDYILIKCLFILDIIKNEAGFEELEKIFREYGEEKFSKEIAKKVLEYRKKEKITRTSQLAEIAVEVYKKKGSREKIHPATRIFQALRIAVNNEIQVLKDVLPQTVDNLKVSGRVAVISFHSLEDRVVKHFFKSQQGKLKIITKKPISVSEGELNENRRARSAKLRVAEKI